MAGTALHTRKGIVKEASYAERVAEKEMRIVKKFIHLFEIKGAYINRLAKRLKEGKKTDKTKRYCINLIYLQHALLKKEERAVENVDIEFRKIIDYDSALKDTEIHGAVAKAYKKYARHGKNLVDELQKLSGILTEQYNRLKTPDKYRSPYSELSNLFRKEQQMLQREFRIWEEEEKGFENVEEKAKAADPAKMIEGLLNASTLVLWGNSDEFNTSPHYYHFSQGMQLRLIVEPGLNKKRIGRYDEWARWKEFTQAFVHYPKPGKRTKRGRWTGGFNFFVYSMPYGSDQAGRAAVAVMGVGYPESYEPHVDQIVNNEAHRKMLTKRLKKIFGIR